VTSGRRDPLAVVALVLAALALLVSVVTFVRVGSLVKAHNELVAQLNRERSGPGALLEAAGVPGGRIIGDILDAGRQTPEEAAAKRARNNGKWPDRRDR
jgi:hypothetical protein